MEKAAEAKAERAEQADPRSEYRRRLLELPDQPLTAFFKKHGRLPSLDKGEKPWEFRGWLMFYIQGWHADPRMLKATGNRWDYYDRTVERGRMLDEPLPYVHYLEHVPENNPTLKQLEKWVEMCEDYSWSSLTYFVHWLGYALGTRAEPSALTERAQERLYRNVQMQLLLEHPADYFATMMCVRKGSGKWNPTGFYPTPMTVCRFMVECLFEREKDHRRESVLEPACGTGSMMLHAANFSMNIYGIDIDPLCCAIAAINGALYAPWIAFPLPPICFAREDRAVDVTLPQGIANADTLRNPPHTSSVRVAPLPAEGAARIVPVEEYIGEIYAAAEAAAAEIAQAQAPPLLKPQPEPETAEPRGALQKRTLVVPPEAIIANTQPEKLKMLKKTRRMYRVDDASQKGFQFDLFGESTPERVEEADAARDRLQAGLGELWQAANNKQEGEN